MQRRPLLHAAMTLLGLPAFATTAAEDRPNLLLMWHFPNITHFQAPVAHGLSRRGDGRFEQKLGRNLAIESYVFNAGKTVIGYSDNEDRDPLG
ncbi:MAG: hypothetical protein JO227_15985 [Acetobacteraceae bacterium]|nr:hypothetical protein [Acetobacteraceae bacterium]